MSSIGSFDEQAKSIKNKLDRFSHCVTINYVGERKVDIVPCVVDREAASPAWRSATAFKNAFEASEPEAIHRLADRAEQVDRPQRPAQGHPPASNTCATSRAGSPATRCCSRPWSAPASTLADADNTVDFADVPTALKTIMGRLDDWLARHPSRPTVTNPVLAERGPERAPGTTTATPISKKCIHRYRAWIDDAYDEEDSDESLGKWRRVFGTKFARGAASTKAAAVSDAATESAPQSTNSHVPCPATSSPCSPSKGPSPCPAASTTCRTCSVRAGRTLKHPMFAVNDLGGAVRRHEMVVRHPRHQPPDRPATEALLDRVPRSTTPPHGSSARARLHRSLARDQHGPRGRTPPNCLRGGIIPANSTYSHWEYLRYRGVHMVEAFIVLKQDDVLVAYSKPFYVTIE
jgi:hypothetical protein